MFIRSKAKKDMTSIKSKTLSHLQVT